MVAIVIIIMITTTAKLIIIITVRLLCGSKLNADDNDEVEAGSRKAEALSGHGTHCFLRALHMIFLSCCCCYNRIFSVQENREISVIVDDNK